MTPTPPAAAERPLPQACAEIHDAPLIWIVCGCCDGEGTVQRRITVYEHGCGFGHDDYVDEQCKPCAGQGGWIEEDEGN